ncbi:MAG TPA: STAS domain-containing protein [Bryobacteraceae bacterium]|nr:STAS domain-containing protein [Bryobacteraceae bacterium]
MALAIDQREREDILILALAGRLTMGPEDAEFRIVVQSCIAANKTKIILDCSRLENIDSVCLGTLVLFRAKLRAGGRVVLVNIARTNMELSVLAKLDVLFEVFADEHDAVSSFFPDRAVRHWDVLKFAQEQNGQQDVGVGGTTHDDINVAPS